MKGANKSVSLLITTKLLAPLPLFSANLAFSPKVHSPRVVIPERDITILGKTDETKLKRNGTDEVDVKGSIGGDGAAVRRVQGD